MDRITPYWLELFSGSVDTTGAYDSGDNLPSGTDEVFWPNYYSGYSVDHSQSVLLVSSQSQI